MGQEISQLLIPYPFRVPLLKQAHDNPLGAHMGCSKIEARLMKQSFWPQMYDQIEKFCQACPACQRVNWKKAMRVPLQSMLIVGITFSCITLDVVGLLPKRSSGYQFFPVIIDYVIWSPAVIPTQTVMGP